MKNWTANVLLADQGRIEKIRLLDSSDRVVSYRDFVIGMCQDDSFRSFFNQTLCESSFKAFRFETPPVSETTYDQDFEFVLLEADYLDGRVDSQTFREHFEPSESVVVFYNLSGKSPMIVPCPIGDSNWYGHLASFVRMAGQQQIDDLWRVCGQQMQERINEQKLWFNTHGGGVAWLHVRIDNRPKYYGYLPYKNQ